MPFPMVAAPIDIPANSAYGFPLFHILVGSKKAKPTESKNRMVVPRGCKWGKWGDVGESIQASCYKMNKFGGSNVHPGDHSL